MDQAITAPVTEFVRLSGISRARVYEMLSAGQLESVSIGRRRLIKVDSYRKLIAGAEHIPAPQRSKVSETLSPSCGSGGRMDDPALFRRGREAGLPSNLPI